MKWPPWKKEEPEEEEPDEHEGFVYVIHRRGLEPTFVYGWSCNQKLFGYAALSLKVGESLIIQRRQ